jgi:hypothetical protein
MAEGTHTLRADSGFCREELMAWCEANDVQYLFGSRNEWLRSKKAGPPYGKPSGHTSRVLST